MEQKTNAQLTILYNTVLIIISGAFLWLIYYLFSASMQEAENLFVLLKEISQWFDRIFFQYNLILFLLSVAITPILTLIYIYKMKEEKKQRLYKDFEFLSKKRKLLKYEKICSDIDKYIAKTFSLQNYAGSLALVTIFIALGSMIILLLKPMPFPCADTNADCMFNSLTDAVNGIDYRRGANFLISGPYLYDYISGDKLYLEKITSTLTAFQFGFLGAYIYFIIHFSRSYFTLDLTPDTFVASTIRLVMGSILALVFSFAILYFDDKAMKAWIPVISFFIGFFPNRGLLIIEKLCIGFINSLAKLATRLGIKFFSDDKIFDDRAYNTTYLSELPGINYQHEVRLNREGYDNVENLAHADAIEMTIRTGFKYHQLKQWISQAKLFGHLGISYKEFVAQTGISSISELRRFYQKCKRNDPNANPVELLSASIPEDQHGKLKVLCTLYCRHKKLTSTPLQPNKVDKPDAPQNQ